MNNKGKTKLCYLIPSLCNEGPVNVIYNILQNIDYKSFDVSIITLKPEKKNSRIGDFTSLPLHIYQLASDKRNNILVLYFKLKRLLKNIKPDVIHGHCSEPLYLMALLPYKTVYTIHIYPGMQNISISGPILGRLIVFFDNLFTRLCDRPICCSDSIAFEYKKNKSITYDSIPNGTSYKTWHYSKEEKQRLRAELQLDKTMKYFIFIGRFSKEKNPEILIDVFSKRKDIGLIMLGEGPLWDNLYKKKTSNIIMPGFTTKVSNYLKASDYYISTSDIEGLANTLLESMSVGLPFILSDIPSHKEVCNTFVSLENVGCLTNHHNEVAISKSIDKLMKIDCDAARHDIQDVFESHYTAEIMTRKYELVYKSLSHNE